MAVPSLLFYLLLMRELMVLLRLRQPLPQATTFSFLHLIDFCPSLGLFSLRSIRLLSSRLQTLTVRPIPSSAYPLSLPFFQFDQSLRGDVTPPAPLAKDFQSSPFFFPIIVFRLCKSYPPYISAKRQIDGMPTGSPPPFVLPYNLRRATGNRSSSVRFTLSPLALDPCLECPIFPPEQGMVFGLMNFHRDF